MTTCVLFLDGRPISEAMAQSNFTVPECSVPFAFDLKEQLAGVACATCSLATPIPAPLIHDKRRYLSCTAMMRKKGLKRLTYLH